MSKYRKVRGMHDILPGETGKWQFAEGVLTDIAKNYGYKEIRPPVIEERALFERSIGTETEIVSKELYAFNDKKGRELALRPEGTASVVRAFVESGHARSKKITRLYYYGQMFRYDRPQKGRYRQFYQFGIELLGGTHPFFDGEVIAMLNDMAIKLDITGHCFHVNTLGCAACKNRYSAEIKKYMEGIKTGLCTDCHYRIDTAPLRILDCKNAACRKAAKNAPSINDIICRPCKDHFSRVKDYLQKSEIPYKVQTNLVRGLDYYTKTVFELFADDKENAIAAGGRYDSLVSDIGGPDIPSVGFAIGMERLLPLIKAEKRMPAPIYCIFAGEKAKLKGIEVSMSLRKAGIPTETDYEERGLKAYIKEADRTGAKWCIIIGERELEKNQILLKNMSTGEQENLSAFDYLKRIKELTQC